MELVVKNQNLPDWKEEEGGRRRKERVDHQISACGSGNDMH